MEQEIIEAVESKVDIPMVCGNCEFRNPKNSPIPVPIPPNPGTVMQPGRVECMPMVVCTNPKSPNAFHFMHPKGTCEFVKLMPPKIQNKPPPKSRIITN